MKKLLMPLAAILASLSLTAPSEAATASGTLNVGATAVPTCSVTTTAVDFGSAIGQSNVYANGDVTVICSNGVPYNIAMDRGLHGDGLTRRVSTGTYTIPYNLDKVSNVSRWGDSDFANTYQFGSSLADIGTGSAQPHTVWGVLTGSGPDWSWPSGTYSDTVTVTVHY